MIYLDYNATAPLRPGVKEAMLEVLDDPGNASSIHAHGRTARKQIETARAQVADLVGATAEQVTFNSGATEANNTILNHYADQQILISAIEHPCIQEACRPAAHIPVTRDGLIDLAALETLMETHQPALVSVMLVNNETGVIQPIEKISTLCRVYQTKLHVDGAQATGKIPFNMAKLGIDYLPLSAHKMGGPQGIGALIVRQSAEPPVLLHGGGQEKRKRGGTENTAGIIGFGVAAAHAKAHIEEFRALSELQNRFETGLRNMASDVVVFGEGAERVANTTCCAIPGTTAETILIAMDLAGICISSGSACSRGKVGQSATLGAMDAPDDLLKAALRISTGWFTTQEEIDKLLEELEKVVKRMRA